MSGPGGARHSEDYRGYEILYDAAARKWLVETDPALGFQRFDAAFQARRHINVALDGTSATWPKRSVDGPLTNEFWVSFEAFASREGHEARWNRRTSLRQTEGPVAWNMRVRVDGGEAELLIERDSRPENATLFNALKTHSAEIEERAGLPIRWDEVAGRRRFRVAAPTRAFNVLDENSWPEIWSALLTDLRALEGAIRPFLATSAPARERGPDAASPRWTEETFLAESDKRSHATASIVRRFLQWTNARPSSVRFGEGPTGPLYFAPPSTAGQVPTVALTLDGRLEVLFNSLVAHPPFDRASARIALQRRLNRIVGFDVKDEVAEAATWQSLDAAFLLSPGAFDEFTGVYDWVARQLETGSLGE